MIGVSLSRWTMSYFGAALLALIAAELLMVLGFGYPALPLGAPRTLILVHVVALGWLSLLMCGALLQFLPVLVAQPLYSNRLGLPALVLLLAGLASLILGFLQLDGEVGLGVPFLAIAAVLLILGFALIVWNLARTICAAKTMPLQAWFVVVGLAGLTLTAALGTSFALALGGSSSYGPLLTLTAFALPVHAVAGLGAWLTFTAIGVSYRLLAMFMLAPELDRKTTRGSLWLGSIALGVAVVGGIVTALVNDEVWVALLAGLAIGIVALVLYGIDIVHLYRARKRKIIELNSRMAAAALASFAATAVLIVVLLASGRLGEDVAAVVFLAAFGWLSGLGLAQLYKIVAFLTWLECYGPILGKAPTPRVQDLVIEAHADKWFMLYFAAAWVGTAALLAGQPLIFRAAAVGLLVSTVGIVVQLVRTRRLADVKQAIRSPKGARAPHLLISYQRP